MGIEFDAIDQVNFTRSFSQENRELGTADML